LTYKCSAYNDNGLTCAVLRCHWIDWKYFTRA